MGTGVHAGADHLLGHSQREIGNFTLDLSAGAIAFSHDLFLSACLDAIGFRLGLGNDVGLDRLAGLAGFFDNTSCFFTGSGKLLTLVVTQALGF